MTIVSFPSPLKRQAAIFLSAFPTANDTRMGFWELRPEPFLSIWSITAFAAAAPPQAFITVLSSTTHVRERRQLPAQATEALAFLRGHFGA
ncbi:MAG: hypothetical protein LBR80_03810 [Deltaproteobacteria bacterium]|nr:hypothetical protein [Deltaproteobacteria bacterium]